MARRSLTKEANMDKEQVKIEKMVLNIDGEKVSLSMEQAKKLKGLLDELFGKEVIKEVVEKHHYPYWYWQPHKWVNYSTTENMDSICMSTNKSLQVSL